MALLSSIQAAAAFRTSIPLHILILSTVFLIVLASILINVLHQVIFKNPNKPPVVFHWIPYIGNTVSYGIDPYKFFFSNQKKYGDCFTFILLGRKITVFLGPKGNNFIFNGKLHDLNAEEIYSPLTTPVFGKGIVYDVHNAKFMEQKRMIKFGLTTDAFKSYVPLIVSEAKAFLSNSPFFAGRDNGSLDVLQAMSELTIYTASRCLQGKEVRDKFDGTFAALYHDLDMGFRPINFLFPYLPLPHNRRRDKARRKMREVYLGIMRARRDGQERKEGGEKAKGDKLQAEPEEEKDMINHLMNGGYKDGTPFSEREVAHMMTALLMAGQHSSAATMAWILLRLATKPELISELYAEQVTVFGSEMEEITYDSLPQLKLHSFIIKETLRLHSPIHSIMRKVKSPMRVDETNFVVPPGHILLASPGAVARTDGYFPNAMKWDPHRWQNGGVREPEALPKEEEKVDYGYGLVSKGTASAYLPFGAGRHRCIGEGFAYLQLTVLTAMLVRELRLRSVDGKTDVVETDYSSLLSKPLQPARIRWERRVK